MIVVGGVLVLCSFVLVVLREVVVLIVFVRGVVVLKVPYLPLVFVVLVVL